MNTPTLGIDLAAAQFEAAIWFDEKHSKRASFANHATGFEQLGQWLQSSGSGSWRVGLESTGHYGQALAHWLHEHGHQVHVINPERTAAYARSIGQRNKTDAADSVMIAAYTAKHALTRWSPASAEQDTLRAYTRTRHQLQQQRQQLANQRSSAPAAVLPVFEALIADFDRHLATLDEKIDQHLAAHAALAEQVERLCTVKGIGRRTATIAIAELPTIHAHTDARAICAWVGLTPKRHQSGRTEWRAHLSRKGNTYLRDALFMPALVAKRYNPVLKTFAQRLALRGKSNNSILGAIAHKLLRILVGILKSKTNFDPNRSSMKT